MVLNGAAIDEVLPKENVEVLDFEDKQDPLESLHLEDPTAIVTEYRFVIALTQASRNLGEAEDEEPTDDGLLEVEE